MPEAGTLHDFLERVISDGIAAATADYGPGEKLEGSLAGFEACRGKTPAQLATLLAEAMLETHAAYRISPDPGPGRYWYWRCRELEIEWVCNCVSAILLNEGLPVIIRPTVRGMLKAAAIVGVGNPDPVADEESATYHLCCACGTISRARDWTYWHRNLDEATEEETPWVPARDGETDPMALCPACNWKHQDTDDGSGYYQGTLAEMEQQRAADLPEYSEIWEAALEEANVRGR